MTSSPSIVAALDVWRSLRADYQVHLEGAHARASEELNGVLLNARGKAAGKDSMAIFMGPRYQANAYASEELSQWWDKNGRLTFADYEAQNTETPGHHWGHSPEREG